MRLFLTGVALLCVCILSYRKGGGPERYVAITLVVFFCVGLINRAIQGTPAFMEFQTSLFVLECLTLASFLFTALKANRVWPLWISALQLLIVSAHVAAFLGVPGVPVVYWGMTALPSYLQVAVLMIGIRSHVRRFRMDGAYPDWR